MQEIDAREGSANDPDAMERSWRLFFRPFFHDPTLSDSLALDFGEQWLANYAATAARVQESVGRYDIHRQLKRITAPTLIVHGDASTISMDAAMSHPRTHSDLTSNRPQGRGAHSVH